MESVEGGKIAFEIHLTVNDLSRDEISKFTEVCINCGGKSLLIEFSGERIIRQPMLGITIEGSFLPEILLETETYAVRLEEAGFLVQRKKIEINARDVELFSAKNNFSTYNYFEWHGKIELEKVEEILEICRNHRVNLSKNALRGEFSTRFITLREHGERELFERRVENMVKDLEKCGCLILKQDFEYCIYDSKIELDAGWLT